MDKIEDITAATDNTLNRNKNDEVIRHDVQLSIKSLFYTWSIGNFSNCLKFCDPKLHSPEFTIDNTSLRLQLQISERNGEKIIVIRLNRETQGKMDHFIQNKVTLLDDQGIILPFNAIKSNFQSDDTTLDLVILRGSLPLILINDKLVVHCEFSVLSSSFCHNTSTNKNFNVRNRMPSPKVSKRPDKPLISHFCFNIFYVLIMFTLVMCFLMTVESCVKNIERQNGFFDTKYLTKRSEINKLIVDSTVKMKLIAEAFNLTDVKIKCTEILETYLKMYNHSFSSLPSSLWNMADSDFLMSKIKQNNVTDSKLPMSNNLSDAPEKNI